MKLAADQTFDTSGAKLYMLFNGIDLPEFVKSAELDTQESLIDLEKEAFADEGRKLFPINTPARTYTSNAFYFIEKTALARRYGKEYADRVGEKIAQAVKLFNIENEVDEYLKIASDRFEKNVPICNICTVSAINENGQIKEIELFPIKSSEDLTKSADIFVKNIWKYPFDWRSEIADGFITKSAMFNVDELPELVFKYAGYFYPDTNVVKEELFRRKVKLASEDNKNKLDQLINLVDSIEDKEEVFKIAQIVEQIEKNEGIKFSKVNSDLVDRFFCLSVDKVASMLNVVEMAGETFDVADLKKISTEIYKQAFGIDLDPSKEADLKDILPTMPLTDVSLFKELSGVRPID